jgi:hypothetical protein
MLILIMCNAQTPAFVESLYIPPAPLKCTAFRDCHINPLPAIDQRIVVLEGVRRTMPTLSQEERASLAAPSPTGAGLPANSIDWLGRMLPLQQVLNIHLVCSYVLHLNSSVQALVVPFNPVIMAVEPCNSACIPTGTPTGARACTYYASKYESKDRCGVCCVMLVQCYSEYSQNAFQQRHNRNRICTAHGPPTQRRAPECGA